VGVDTLAELARHREAGRYDCGIGSYSVPRVPPSDDGFQTKFETHRAAAAADIADPLYEPAEALGFEQAAEAAMLAGKTPDCSVEGEMCSSPPLGVIDLFYSVMVQGG
jgi:hypothetical protein